MKKTISGLLALLLLLTLCVGCGGQDGQKDASVGQCVILRVLPDDVRQRGTLHGLIPLDTAVLIQQLPIDAVGDLIHSATNEPLSEEDAAAKKAQAEDLLSQLQASEDLEALFPHRCRRRPYTY